VAAVLAAVGQARTPAVSRAWCRSPPFGLRCWWARAADDSSTTSDAQYSRRLAIWGPSKVSSATSRRCVDLQAGAAAARLQSPKAGCAQSSLG
jgi:hypothetical protein